MKTIFRTRIFGFLALLLWIGGQNVAIAQCTESAAGGTIPFLTPFPFVGQQFTPSCSGNVAQASFDFDAAKSYGVTATIRTDACPRTILGTASTAGNVVAGTNTVTFVGVPVTMGITYVLELAATGGGSIGGVLHSNSSSTGPYAGGDAYDANIPCGSAYIGLDLNFSVAIASPCASFTATAANTPILCHGGTSVVTVTASGGTTPYTGDGPQAPIPAGPYSYTVTDANNCSFTVSGTINEPPAVVPTVSPALSCLTTGYGPTSVTLVASGTGGTGTIPNTTLTVSPTTTSTACVNNFYTLTVTDANGCSANATANVMTRDVRCYPNGNGPAKVNVCHVTGNNGTNTLCVDVTAVASHLSHGDVLGACGSAPCCPTGNARLAYSAPHFKVYPNPTNQVISMDIPYSDNEVRVLITDVLGRIAIDKNVAANLNSPAAFNIGNMPGGVYIVKVTVDGVIYTDKFTKR